MKNQIEIIDWAGNELFKGHYKSSKVDAVLKANKCPFCRDFKPFFGAVDNPAECNACDNTGYEGDFDVYWLDKDETRNVYEHINY